MKNPERGTNKLLYLFSLIKKQVWAPALANCSWTDKFA